MSKGNYFAHIHSSKEIENFLIIPSAIKAAIEDKLREYNAKSNKSKSFDESINDLLSNLTNEFKNKVQAQLQSHRLKFEKQFNPKLDNSTIIESSLTEFDDLWGDLSKRLKIIPGKEYLSNLNQYLQDNYGIAISYTNIINNINKTNFPEELKLLLMDIEKFRKEKVDKHEA